MGEKTKVYARLLLLLPLFSLSGCLSDVAMRRIHVDYVKAYGDASNQQLLLNLARLANADPVHFVQLASISSGFTFTAGGGFNPSYVKNGPGYFTSGSTITTGGTPPTGQNSVVNSFGEFVKNSLTLGGSATGTASENPIFQFIPLTGSNLVDAVLTPIPNNVFYTLYDQNWPADIVARTMLQSVEHAVIVTNIATNGSQPFVAEEITNLTSIVNELKNSSNALHDLLWTNFNTNELYILTSYVSTNRNTNQVRAIIVKALNRAVENTYSNSIYDPLVFSKVHLRDNTASRLTKPQKGSELARLNRQLLEDASNYLLPTNSSYTITNYENWVNDVNYETYPDFLEFCTMLHQAQISHTMGVDQSPTPNGDLLYNSTNAKLTDVVSAVQANLNVKWDTNNDVVTVKKPKTEARFTTYPNYRPLTNGFSVYKYSEAQTSHVAPSRAVGSAVGEPVPEGALRETFVTNSYYTNGFPVTEIIESIPYTVHNRLFTNQIRIVETNIISTFVGDTQHKEADIRDADWIAQEYASNRLTFKLRTFEAAMYTVANEEGRFRKYAITGNADSTFSDEDSQKLSTLAARLLSHSRPLPKFLWNGMAIRDQYAISNAPQSRASLELVRQHINNVIASGTSIYDADRFRGITLRRLTINLLQQNPKARASIRLNRLLLEDAFPELPKISPGAMPPPYNNIFFRTDSDGPYAIVTRKATNFWPEDIRNVAGFADKLENASRFPCTDPVSYLLWSNLPVQPPEELAMGVPRQGANMEIARTNIATSLTRLVNGASLVDLIGPFIKSKGIILRPETSYLLSVSPQSDDFNRRLNFLLLEDYYQHDLAEDSRFKVRPLMTLTRRTEEAEILPYHKLAEIWYDNGATNQAYYVGDPKGIHQDEEVFTMLSYLFAQTAVSTQNLPVQQTIRSQ